MNARGPRWLPGSFSSTIVDCMCDSNRDDTAPAAQRQPLPEARQPTWSAYRYYVDLCTRYRFAPMAKDMITAAECSREIDRLANRAKARVGSKRARRKSRPYGKKGTMY